MRSEKESRNGTKVIKLSQNRDEKCKDVTKTKKVVDFLIAMDIINYINDEDVRDYILGVFFCL